jgi:hypothetical protein
MSKFTSFLKKAGLVLTTVLQDAAIAIPALQPFINLTVPASKQPAVNTVITTAESEISLLSQSVMTAETTANTLAAGGTTLSGAQKAAIAAPAILQVFLNSEAMAGKKIANPAAAQAAAATIAGGVADFWNAVDGSALPNPPTTTTVPAPEPAAS